MVKKYRLEVKEQHWDFDYMPEAQAKAMNMIANGCWFMNLREIDTEVEEKENKSIKSKKS